MFACNGPITGYQLQAQIPLTGVQSPPLVDTFVGKPATDTFSCSLAEVPGYAENCVGGTKLPFEAITGQFSIGTKLCAEPRVDPLLTVTYAYLEKSVITQAISGPFDLGRPLGCKPDALSGGTRMNPKRRSPHTTRRARRRQERRRRSSPARGRRARATPSRRAAPRRAATACCWSCARSRRSRSGLHGPCAGRRHAAGPCLPRRRPRPCRRPIPVRGSARGSAR